MDLPKEFVKVLRTSLLNSLELPTYATLLYIRYNLYGICEFRSKDSCSDSAYCTPELYLDKALEEIESLPQKTIPEIVEKGAQLLYVKPFADNNAFTIAAWLESAVRRMTGKRIDWESIDIDFEIPINGSLDEIREAFSLILNNFLIDMVDNPGDSYDIDDEPETIAAEDEAPYTQGLTKDDMERLAPEIANATFGNTTVWLNLDTGEFIELMDTDNEYYDRLLEPDRKEREAQIDRWQRKVEVKRLDRSKVYDLMCAFADSYPPDSKPYRMLWQTLSGSKPMSNFNRTTQFLNLRNEWHAFHDEANLNHVKSTLLGALKSGS